VQFLSFGFGEFELPFRILESRTRPGVDDLAVGIAQVREMENRERILRKLEVIGRWFEETDFVFATLVIQTARWAEIQILKTDSENRRTRKKTL